MEDKEAVDAIIEAIQATASAARATTTNKTGGSSEGALKYATATRELAQALQALGLGLAGR